MNRSTNRQPSTAYGLALSSLDDTLRRIDAPFAPTPLGLRRRLAASLPRCAGWRAVMRRRWDHTAPAATQAEPADDASEHVEGQVRRWTLTGELVHPESALEIAAWWQSPAYDGIDCAVFASTGRITDDLADAISRQIVRSAGAEVDDLSALDAYVRAAIVTPYVIGHNIAGYLPESDTLYALDYANAVELFRSELAEYREHLPECECLAEVVDTAGELCEGCSEDAYGAAYLADEVRDHGGRELHFTTARESEVLPTVYWLTVGEPVTYGEFLAARDGCHV